MAYPILLDIRKQYLRMLTPASEEYSSSWVQEQPLTLPKTSPIWWTLIIGLSPVPPYDLNLYNYNMHDSNKKLLSWEQIAEIFILWNRILFPQKIRHTAQRRVSYLRLRSGALRQTRQECIIFLSVPEFFKEIWLSYPILPEFYQNSLFCRTEKRIEFHKPRFL